MILREEVFAREGRKGKELCNKQLKKEGLLYIVTVGNSEVYRGYNELFATTRYIDI